MVSTGAESAAGSHLEGAKIGGLAAAAPKNQVEKKRLRRLASRTAQG
jgi:hypothetical protein